MTTDTRTEMDQNSPVTFKEIWNNLVVTDQQENQFQFSTCKNRHIVVLGSKKTAKHVVGDIIRRDTYNPYYQPIKEEQNTITYVMVQDDPSYNICIINLIDIPPIEYFIKRSQKNSEDLPRSPMAELDKAIYKFTTDIDLIVLVCEENDFELMKNMKNWASNRGYVMALVFIVNPKRNIQQREEFLLSIRENKAFIANDLCDFFDKGIFCISDLSYSNFRSPEEQQTAQNYVPAWRTKFLRACVGGHNDKPYKIVLCDEKQSKNASFCNTS